MEAFLLFSSRWRYNTNFWFLLPELPQVEGREDFPLLPSEAWLHVVLFTACVSGAVGAFDAASLTTPREAPGCWVIPLQMGSGSVAVSQGGGEGEEPGSSRHLCCVWCEAPGLCCCHWEGRRLESWVLPQLEDQGSRAHCHCCPVPCGRVPLCLRDWSGMHCLSCSY